MNGLVGIPGIQDKLDGVDQLQPGVIRDAKAPLAYEFLIGEGQVPHLLRGKVPFQTHLVPGLGLIHQSLKILTLHAGHHGPGLEKPAVIVPGQIGVAVSADVIQDQVFIKADIMDSGHHPRHGNGTAAAHR